MMLKPKKVKVRRFLTNPVKQRTQLDETDDLSENECGGCNGDYNYTTSSEH